MPLQRKTVGGVRDCMCQILRLALDVFTKAERKALNRLTYEALLKSLGYSRSSQVCAHLLIKLGIVITRYALACYTPIYMLYKLYERVLLPL